VNEITQLKQIRQHLLRLFQSNPHIRINVSLQKPKLSLCNVPVKIVGVYPHIFQIEETSSEGGKRYTLQYTDILLHNIEILDAPDTGETC